MNNNVFALIKQITKIIDLSSNDCTLRVHFSEKRVHFSSASYHVQNFTQIKDYIITIFLYVSEQVTM